LFLLLAFVVGVAIRSFFAVPYEVIFGCSLAAMVVVVVGFLRRNKKAIVYGFLLLALFAGVIRFDFVEKSQPKLSSFYGRPQELRGVVWDEPEKTASVQRLKIRAELSPQKFYILVTTRKYPEYKIGDEVAIRGLLERPFNYGDFDYISFLARQDIFSTMSFPLIEKVGENKGNKVKLFLSRVKHSFENNVKKFLPEPHASFLNGLLLGERESLPQELVENFNRTGTTHIVALSGYNITLVGRFLTGLLLFLTVPFQISFWIAVVAIFFFVIMTGASASVVRAGIMGVLVLLAQKEGRMYRMTNALVFAATAMVFHNPQILRFDAAFQLSFLATLGLVYLSPRIGDILDKVFYKIRPRLFVKKSSSRKLSDTLKQIFIETLSAQIAVLPLLVYLFGRVSLISPLTNILILVAVPYSMAFGFLAGIGGFFWEPLARIFGGISWLFLEYKIRVIDFFAKFPAASVNVGKWLIPFLAAFYGFLLFKIWKHSRKIL